MKIDIEKLKKALKLLFKFAISVLVFISLIYFLYKVATLNKTLFNYIFLIALSGIIIYKTVNALLNKSIKNILTFLLNFLFYILRIIFFLGFSMISIYIVLRAEGIIFYLYIILSVIILTLSLILKPFKILKNFIFKVESY